MFSRESDWTPCIRYFSEKWNVIAPNLPVFDLPPKRTGVEGLCDYVTSLLDQNGVRQVVAVGNSLGGHIALLLTLRQPERVRGLVLTGSSGLFERGFERGIPLRPGKEWLEQRIRQVFYDARHVTEELIAEVCETLSDSQRARKIIKLAKSAKKHNIRSDLHRIQCPVWLVWGKDDQITPPAVAHEFNEHIPRSNLYFIDQCGHAPTLEQPERFNQIMDGCLKREFGA